ncbi:MAG: flagellin [Phycisphaerae bacterium]
MGLTINNVNTLSLLNILNNTSEAQTGVIERLTTGRRINRGSDDPAGLIALKSLESELVAVDASVVANQRTKSILNVADNALGQIGDLVKQIQSLSQASANSAALSPDELAANQAQIDNALESIDRIVRTTEFNGKKLLDGSQGIDVSGVDSSKISDVRVFNRDSGSSSTNLSVAVNTAAEKATISGYATTSAASDTSISIQGKLGSAVISITSGENLSSVAAKINAATAQTGVVASANGANLSLTSQTYGTSAFVRVTTLSGDATNFTNQNDTGVNAGVTVNGNAASVDGLNVNYSAGGVNASFSLTESFGTTANGSETFQVTTGGATFQLGSDSSTRVTIGIDGLFSQQLGSSTLGYLHSLKSGGANSLLTNPSQAAAIASEAAGQLAKQQGRLGGFSKFQVDTALSAANATKKGLESARGALNDVDYATETAELNRQNVLLTSGISLLGLVNQRSAQILSLLR